MCEKHMIAQIGRIGLISQSARINEFLLTSSAQLYLVSCLMSSVVGTFTRSIWILNFHPDSFCLTTRSSDISRTRECCSAILPQNHSLPCRCVYTRVPDYNSSARIKRYICWICKNVVCLLWRCNVFFICIKAEILKYLDVKMRLLRIYVITRISILIFHIYLTLTVFEIIIV